MPIINARDNKRTADFLFLIRYMPRVALNTVKYGFYGALFGFGSSFLFSEALKRFAAENPEVVNLDGQHVPDDEQFLKFSRHSAFTKHTPPMSEMIPIYSAIVGGCAGAFFGLNKSYMEFSEKRLEDRELRRLDMV
ncbi:hypothetical protein Lste_1044 [Legionella steelei]|uniref:Uncharacterized protein n=1 Tax=Legionella steelei TaxID=947033 RepID=A0A0W0ZG93_9GAMM|nr:hypothetical protein [Legionella steelei]KTD67886.1 hypothetical protein Lste_1044 [Legionella steelei]